MTLRNTSHEDQWETARNATPLQDAWLESLLAHNSESHPIGDPVARDLLREVLRLRQNNEDLEKAFVAQAAIKFVHCSLSGEFHVVRDDKRCEVCDCEPVLITPDNLEETFKRIDKFWSDRCLEEKLRADTAEAALSDTLQATHRHKKRGTMYRLLSNPILQKATNHQFVEGDRLIVYVGEDGQAWARWDKEFDDGRFETVNNAFDKVLPTRTDFLPTKDEIARAICRAGTDLDEDGGAESDCDENGPCGTTEGGSCIAPELYDKASAAILDLVRRKA